MATSISETKFAALKNKLRELFELDKSDLDFGIYRIMAARNKEVTAFLDRELKETVREVLQEHSTGQSTQLQSDLDKAIDGAKALGIDPESVPKVQELREKVRTAGGGSVDDLEADIYNHLLTFFSRYYDEGDFISKRYYKGDTYAIPYNGEEVTLHWANKDQYYIKSGEWHKDYSFRVDDRMVRFKLLEATQEANNNKEPDEEKRRFIIDHRTPVEETASELVLRFEFRVPTASERALIADTEATRIFGGKYDAASARQKGDERDQFCAYAEMRAVDAMSADWKRRVASLQPTATKPNRTLLGKQLDHFSARNTFDYFIHKDLHSFLHRELSFYLKTEVIRLDDVATMLDAGIVKLQGKVGAIRKVAGRIIALLAGIEQFQKKLWLKKKFVLKHDICISINDVPASLKSEVFSNERQLADWRSNFLPADVDLTNPSVTASQYPMLPVDTDLFSRHFSDRLKAECSLITDGPPRCLFGGDNFQVLNLLRTRFKNSIRCVYIDPPYNTGNDDFAYKDTYQHSSWCSCLYDRLLLAHELLANTGSILVSIGAEELGSLQYLLDRIFGRKNRVSLITVKRASVTGHKVINPGVVNVSEFVLIYAKDRDSWIGNTVFSERERDERYSTFIKNRTLPPSGWEFTSVLEAFSETVGIAKRDLRSVLGEEFDDRLTRFVYENAESVCQPVTVDLNGVGLEFREWVERSVRSPAEILVYQREGFSDAYLRSGKKLIFYSEKLRRVGDRLATAERASDIWVDVLPNDLHNEGCVDLRKGKKPEALLSRLLELSTDEGDIVLDFFAGTATTAAVAQKMQRGWIAVECANYFSTKPRVRMKNVLNGDQRGVSTVFGWQGGGAFAVMHIESYDDAMNNLPEGASEPRLSLVQASDSFLRYQLDLEFGPSLLRVNDFRDPWGYTMLAQLPGSGESTRQSVDMIETFNYLLGITVRVYGVIEQYDSTFRVLDHEENLGRLVVDGRLRRTTTGRFVFQRIEGDLFDGTRVLVIWRKLTDDPEQDAAVLDAWLARHREDTKQRSEHRDYHRIYINGPITLPQPTQELRTVFPIEQTFKELMFADTEDV